MAEVGTVNGDADAMTPTKKPRPRSSIAFPYFSLDKSIEVAKILHARAGGQCARGQLAPLLGYSGVNNGGFLTRISAAKMFGLIEERVDAITLTERAKRILAPVRPSEAVQAKLDAFMSVGLYKRVFADFDGSTLPAADGLANLFLSTYKIVPNQVSSALRNLMDSAASAGLFDVGGRTRLVRPIIQNDNGGASTAPSAATDDEQSNAADGSRNGSGNGTRQSEHGGGGAGTQNSRQEGSEMKGVHPALMGLMHTLPAIGTSLGPKRRAALIEAFKSTINVVYPEDEE